MDPSREMHGRFYDQSLGESLGYGGLGLVILLKGRSHNSGHHLEVGLHCPKTVTEEVHRIISAILNIWGQSLETEEQVVEADHVIKGALKWILRSSIYCHNSIYGL